jgi:hypothetical protein
MRQRIAILFLCGVCGGLALWLHDGSPQAQQIEHDESGPKQKPPAVARPQRASGPEFCGAGKCCTNRSAKFKTPLLALKVPIAPPLQTYHPDLTTHPTNPRPPSARDEAPLGRRATPLFAPGQAGPQGRPGRGQKGPARSPQATRPNAAASPALGR